MLLSPKWGQRSPRLDLRRVPLKLSTVFFKSGLTATGGSAPLQFPSWLSRYDVVSVRLQVQSLASLSGLMIWCCRELWRRSQMRLRSHVAGAVA